jgi:NAD(P)-dependent dehydrogenase (short-subunit alcohol dehydrogenase family)
MNTTYHPYPPFASQVQTWPGLSKDMIPRPDCGETSYVGNGRLSGKIALVTGGDSGIGRAVAIAFAREGAKGMINFLPEEYPDANEVINLLQAEGCIIGGYAGDLRSEDFCADLVQHTMQTYGAGINILVNCAGRLSSVDNIDMLDTNTFDNTFKTNVYSPFWLCKYTVKHMNHGDSIINTTSGLANDPMPSLLDYSASKAALSNFTRGLARQLASRGIKVNGVAPGPFWTPLTVTSYPNDSISNFGRDTPMTRPGQPVEIAPLYVLLASDASSYVSGSIWGSDGGKSQM